MSNHQSFAPPPELRVPVSVTTPTGASPVAGHPLPESSVISMSGDAWESAANHVLNIRNQRQVNADTWRSIGEFLDDQHLASLGLHRVKKVEA